MKLFFFVFINVILSNCIFGQYLKVSYNYNTNIADVSMSFQANSELILDESKSIYKIDFANSNSSMIDDESVFVVKPKKGEVFYYKDYNTDSIYYDNVVIFRHYPTKDPLNIFKWELTFETKKILGYECQKAVMQHYGRIYEAYFTTELEFNRGGPWKFDGLPGVILEIKSKDNYLSITANEIQLKNESIIINNPYPKKQKYIDFLEYKRLFNQKYKENNKTEITSDGGTVTQSSPKCHIECLVD